MSPARVHRRLQVLPLLGLTLVWVALWGELSLLNVVAGLIVSALVLVLFPLPPLTLRLRPRPLPLLVLAGRFALDLVVASAQMAYFAVAPWVHPNGRLVPVRLASDDEFLTTITAELTSLVPGTIVVDIDPERRELLLHVFNVRTDADVDRAVAEVQAQERRVLRALAADGGRA